MTVVIKRTNKYKALVATGVPSDVAVALCEADLAKQAPVADEPSPLAQLMDAGWDEETAQAILDSGIAEVTVEPEDTRTEAEILVAGSSYDYTKGRVYVTPSIVEGVVRVTKTGRPEIVQTSGTGRTKAVLINREASGDTSIQNLA